jgi:hypothetical protein
MCFSMKHLEIQFDVLLNMSYLDKTIVFLFPKCVEVEL